MAPGVGQAEERAPTMGCGGVLASGELPCPVGAWSPDADEGPVSFFVLSFSVF